jgi:hypothetical protein
MPQNHRTQPNRPERSHGARYQTGPERDRYRTGDEQRFAPERDDRERRSRGFEGDRGYSRGGYAEEFGYQRGSNYRRDDPSYERYQEENPPWRMHPRGDYESRSGWSYDETRTGKAGRESYDRGVSEYGPAPGTQSFRGRGPRGYRRSDERLKELICERLTDDPRIDASDVSIEVKDQVVEISGAVDNRRTKYEIEEIVESFGGVQDIDNRLRVRSPRSGQSNDTQYSSPQPQGGSDWQPGSASERVGVTTGAETRTDSGTKGKT